MRGLVPGAQKLTRVGLVVSDVDGTLVTTDKVLSARNRAAVQSLAKHGIPFTIISSRPPFGLRMLIEPLNLRLPMAAFNGGVLAGPDLTTLERRPLGGETARAALMYLETCGMDVWLFTEDHWHTRNPGGAHVQHEVRTVQMPPVIVETLVPLSDRAIKLVGVDTDPDRLTHCAAEVGALLGAAATVSRSQSYYLDINAPGIDKGAALGELARLCSVDPADIVTLGDMDNDVPMFRQSGFSVAMGNGSEAARQAASAVTGSNDADGFAEAVERIILPRARGR
jgi:Cof subfamily protein (haloacid dehalogenase superfamily)